MKYAVGYNTEGMTKEEISCLDHKLDELCSEKIEELNEAGLPLPDTIRFHGKIGVNSRNIDYEVFYTEINN